MNANVPGVAKATVITTCACQQHISGCDRNMEIREGVHGDAAVVLLVDS